MLYVSTCFCVPVNELFLHRKDAKWTATGTDKLKA